MSIPTPDACSSSALTVGDGLMAAVSALRAKGIETPDLDARLLLADATGMSAAALIAHRDRALAREEIDALARHLGRRLAREPVSRILGQAEFYGRHFRITPATLDPRPDSETLIDAALELAREQQLRDRPLRIIDVGTGSGCLLLTLLAEIPKSTGIGTDISAAALKTAGENADRLGLSPRAAFMEADLLDAVEGPFDLLVTNPPYIPRTDIAELAPEVAQYDPIVALDGGADGLDIYRKLAGRIFDVVPEGWALFEVGAGQADELCGILYDAGGTMAKGAIRTWRDLAGHERVVAAQTQAGGN